MDFPQKKELQALRYESAKMTSSEIDSLDAFYLEYIATGIILSTQQELAEQYRIDSKYFATMVEFAEQKSNVKEKRRWNKYKHDLLQLLIKQTDLSIMLLNNAIVISWGGIEYGIIQKPLRTST